MTNKQFALLLALAALLCGAYAYYIIPGNFPSPAAGLLLRDDLLRMSER